MSSLTVSSFHLLWKIMSTMLSRRFILVVVWRHSSALVDTSSSLWWVDLSMVWQTLLLIPGCKHSLILCEQEIPFTSRIYQILWVDNHFSLWFTGTPWQIILRFLIIMPQCPYWHFQYCISAPEIIIVRNFIHIYWYPWCRYFELSWLARLIHYWIFYFTLPDSGYWLLIYITDIRVT